MTVFVVKTRSETKGVLSEHDLYILVLFSVYMFCLQFHIFYFTYIFPFTVKVLCLSLHALNFSADDEKKAKREPESSPNTSVEEPKTEVEGGSSGSQGTALKRAYSLSDLNKPNVPRRILPAPPANGNISRLNPHRVLKLKIKLFKLHEPIFSSIIFAPTSNTMLYTTRFSFLFKLFYPNVNYLS